jgi:hypothetical protein
MTTKQEKELIAYVVKRAPKPTDTFAPELKPWLEAAPKGRAGRGPQATGELPDFNAEHDISDDDLRTTGVEDGRRKEQAAAPIVPVAGIGRRAKESGLWPASLGLPKKASKKAKQAAILKAIKRATG